MIKKIVVIIISLIILIILTFYLATGSVDHTPYFSQDYYDITRARLDSITQSAENVFGSLRAGMVKVNITPITGAAEDDPVRGAFMEMPLAGYGDREGKPSEGVHDSLYIRVIALEVDKKVVYMVGCDILIMPPEVADSVALNLASKHKIRREQLFFTATHTHSSFGAWATGWVGSEFAGQENLRVRQWFARQLESAIIGARDDLRPARIATMSFSAPQYVKNRLVGKLGKVDTEFTFLVLEQENGKKGILGAYAAHATTIGASNMLFSAGYPGYWQNKLEEEGTNVAVFSAGSVGSHGPVGKGRGFAKAEFIGEALADSIIQYQNMLTFHDSVAFKYLSCKVRLPEFHVRVSLERHLCTALSKQLLPLSDDVWIQALKIDNLVWITSPCDFSGEFALEIKNALRLKGYRAVISSFNGGYVGYVIPRKYFYMKKYESFTMAWFGPNLGDFFVDIINRMSEGVL
jgi:hypothetical protein